MARDPIVLRIGVILLFAAWLWFINLRVSANRLSYSLGIMWSAASLVGIVFAAAPSTLFFVSDLLGTEVASNSLFVLAILFLVAISFGLTIAYSRRRQQLIEVAQEVGLLRLEVARLNQHFSRGNLE